MGGSHSLARETQSNELVSSLMSIKGTINDKLKQSKISLLNNVPLNEQEMERDSLESESEDNMEEEESTNNSSSPRTRERRRVDTLTFEEDDDEGDYEESTDSEHSSFDESSDEAVTSVLDKNTPSLLNIDTLSNDDSTDNEVGGLFHARVGSRSKHDGMDTSIVSNSNREWMSIDWSDEAVIQSVKSLFVTGSWGEEDARKQLQEDEMNNEELFGDFEDLETGELHKEEEREEEEEGEERRKTKEELKRAFDREYDGDDEQVPTLLFIIIIYSIGQIKVHFFHSYYMYF